MTGWRIVFGREGGNPMVNTVTIIFKWQDSQM